METDCRRDAAASPGPMSRVPPARGPRTVTLKRRLFHLHSWFGFQLAALFALVLVSGTLATVANEIDWLASPHFRVVPTDARASWEQMHAAARAFSPEDGIWWIALGPGAHYAATAVMVRGDGTRYNLRIDPYRGTVTGPDPWLNAQRFLRDLHRYLFMPTVVGLPIVSLFAFLLVFQLYSGFVTTPAWGRAATRLRLRRGVRVAVGDGHRAVGIWATWFMVLMAVTGIWYFAEFSLRLAGVETETPHQSQHAGRTAEFGAVIPHRPLDDYVVAARAAFPELEPRTVRLPFSPGEPVVVDGFAGDILVRDRANEVWLDPSDASVLKVQRSAEMGPLFYITEIADPLHFGTLGGLPTKLIWFVFGLGLSALSITGAWLAWRRLRRTLPTLAQFATAPILVAVVVLSIDFVDRLSRGDALAHPQALPDRNTGSLRLSPKLEASLAGMPSGRVRILIHSSEGGVNLQSARVAACASAVNARIRFAGWSARLDAQLPPAVLAGCRELSVELIYGNGETEGVSWEVSPPQVEASGPRAAASGLRG